MDITDAAQADAVAKTILPKKGRQKKLPTHCFACGAEVKGPYCHICGQKNDDCRRSIFRLCTDSVTDVFALDGRALQTLRAVTMRPGQHVREYGDGRRSPYSPPVRFFLVVSLIFFTVLSLTNRQLVAFNPDVARSDEGAIESVSIDPAFFAKATNSPLSAEEMQFFRDQAGVADYDEEGGENSITINGREFSATSLLDRVMTIMSYPGTFNASLNSWIPKLMIVLIPLMALLGAVFIRGKNALIYDHLLVALNMHSFIFLFLIVAVLGSSLLGFIPVQLYLFGFTLVVPLYYLLTVKGAFQRGWIKTVLSSAFIMAVYSILLAIGLVVVTGQSVLEAL